MDHESSRTAGGLIAVIDDDRGLVAWVSAFLSEAGYRVVGASSRAAAFDLLCQRRPAVLLVELLIDRGQVGWSLLDLLSATPALAGIPVIVWSADAAALHEQARLLAAKGWQWLPKPFQGAQLLALIEQSRPPTAGLPLASQSSDGSASSGQRSRWQG
jgi:DNA-binding response OmpR family regulator